MIRAPAAIALAKVLLGDLPYVTDELINLAASVIMNSVTADEKLAALEKTAMALALRKDKS